MILDTIIHADVITGLKQLPDRCVHTCVTSPPYWALRDYGISGQLGLEKTPEEYIANMVAVFREVKRVLRDDGTLWLNIGDSYAGSGKGPSNGLNGSHHHLSEQSGFFKNDTFKPKDLVGIPWMLAFALRADGWYLRQDIIWHKPNPMPESVTDRCTKAHEYIFLLTKSKHYFYDAEAIKESSIDGTSRKDENPLQRKRFPTSTVNGVRDRDKVYPMANKRSVWSITTQPFSEAHFATFPEELPYLCIKAGTSEHGCCPECNAPYERVVEKEGQLPGRDRNHGGRTDGKARPAQWKNGENPTTTKHLGWRPTCDHSSFVTLNSSIVLDPFSGAATTALVAKKLNRHYIGIELNADYISIANKRLRTELGMFLTSPSSTSQASASSTPPSPPSASPNIPCTP